jgi:hypothetical protein
MKAIIVLGLTEFDTKTFGYSYLTGLGITKILTICQSTIEKELMDLSSFSKLGYTEWVNGLQLNEIKETMRQYAIRYFEDSKESALEIYGSLFINKSFRTDFINLLNDLGYDVEVKIVRPSLKAAIQRNDNKYVKRWQEITHQYSRIYEVNDNKDKQKAIIVNGDFFVSKTQGTEELLSMIKHFYNEKYTIICFYYHRLDDIKQIVSNMNVECLFILRDFETIKESFWRFVFFDYCVRLVIESNPTFSLQWHEINVPVICLENPYLADISKS